MEAIVSLECGAALCCILLPPPPPPRSQNRRPKANSDDTKKKQAKHRQGSKISGLMFEVWGFQGGFAGHDQKNKKNPREFPQG